MSVIGSRLKYTSLRLVLHTLPTHTLWEEDDSKPELSWFALMVCSHGCSASYGRETRTGQHKACTLAE